MRNFNELPQEVQDDVKRALKAYDRAYVIFEYGKYHTSVGISLKGHYAPDHEVIGEYNAKEIFTEDERTINYIESFHDYPIWYKGNRDYRLFDGLGWDARFKLNKDGNIEVA